MLGIQFVQVGDDPDATRALQRLDDALSNKYNIRVRDNSVGPWAYANVVFPRIFQDMVGTYWTPKYAALLRVVLINALWQTRRLLIPTIRSLTWKRLYSRSCGGELTGKWIIWTSIAEHDLWARLYMYDLRFPKNFVLSSYRIMMSFLVDYYTCIIR